MATHKIAFLFSWNIILSAADQLRVPFQCETFPHQLHTVCEWLNNTLKTFLETTEELGRSIKESLDTQQATVNVVEKKNPFAACFTRCPPSNILMNPLVAFQVAFLGEAFATRQAAVGPLSGVDPPVGFQVAQFGKGTSTEGAAEGTLARVGLQVSLQGAGVGETLATLATAQETSWPCVGDWVWMGSQAGRVELGFNADPRCASPEMRYFVMEMGSRS